MSNFVSIRISPWVFFLNVFFSGFFLNYDANADMAEKVVRDFSPQSGVVVMVTDGEIIVDLDASAGLARGDLLSVMSPGEKLVHPVTGKVLGQLETVKGVLKVTRVMEGFSYTKSLRDFETTVGDKVKRYENIRAVFWDYTNNGKPLYLRLQDELSHMNWMDFETAQNSRPSDPQKTDGETAVYFILKNSTLQVRDPQFLVIREYLFSEPIKKQDFLSYGKDKKIVIAPEDAPVSEKYMEKMAPDSEPAEKQKRTEAEQIGKVSPAAPDFSMSKKESAEGVKPVFQKSFLTDQLPGGPVIMADFMPYDNGLLLATTDDQTVYVFHISDKITRLAQKKSTLHDPIVFLSWWKPENSSFPMLAVVHWSDHSPAGSLFSFENNSLKQVKSRIPRLLAGFDSDGDRVPDMLLGQEYDPREFFGRRIQQIQLRGGEISYQDPAVELPPRFTVFGSLLSDLTGDGISEVSYIRNEILYIYSGKDRLYKSPQKMGGSLSHLTYKMNPGEKHLRTNTVSIEISPVSADLDGNGINEMIAVASDRNLLSNTGISPGIKETWLSVLKYEDKMFEEGTIGEKMSTPIQGMTVFRDKLFLVVTESGSAFSKEGQSRLMQWSLAR